MKEYLASMVRGLVDAPGDIHITELQGDKTLIFEIRCAADDVGKIIGKNGKTIGAIRTLLSSSAARQGRRAMLEIVE